MSSEDGSIESAAKGATKGFLEYTEEKVKALVRKFKDRDLAFIQDEKTIEVAKEQRKKSEWVLFKTYVDNVDYHILFQMGLTLRAYERQNIDFNPLKKRILNKFQRKGLYIAHFVQNGLFSKYVGNILEKSLTIEQLKIEITNLFNNIENTVAFIQKTDEIKHKVPEIVTKIRAHSPDTFIISSVGAAIETCDEVMKAIISDIGSKYTVELYSAEVEKNIEENKRIYFLNRKE